jgi:uroporphyrinogen decarboxylase
MTEEKRVLRTLAGESLSPPPIWLMRQAGRYLPEYRATRAEAGSFLDLCYRPDLATEVTLQPIRRYGFDAAILFADILLLPQALGRKLWFETGEGPRLNPLSTAEEIDALASDETMHRFLDPIYQTVGRLSTALPAETTLIGFAGAPWTVATYVIAGRGKEQQAGAKAMLRNQPSMFAALMDRLTEATAAYLIRQIDAGAEVVKVFDSWSGALAEDDRAFETWCHKPMVRIAETVRAARPGAPVILFPRGATLAQYERVARESAVACVAIDESMDLADARTRLQPHATVQGNLDPRFVVEGGPALVAEARRIVDALSDGPFIFNLGHGITPDADPANVEILVKTVRGETT